MNDSDRELRHALKNAFKKDRFSTAPLYRELLGRDASYFNIVPRAVVRPDTPQEVARLLDIARRLKIPVTFRSGGSSLSGQALGEGIVCDLRTGWKRKEVREGGRRIWFEPGLTCRQVNRALTPFKTKIGPDPASQQAAMMGGILANNSSGMQAGTRYNAYRTLTSVEFILANGHRYDSGSQRSRAEFETREQELCKGLMELRAQVLADEGMRNRIERKYRIKNVTGYGMNALVDFDNPMDIFAHLLIGSEGTLGFIASAELETLPLLPVYTSSMLYFENAALAAAAAPMLGESGALAVEMMDYGALMSLSGTAARQLPDLGNLPQGATALLVDYGAGSSEELADRIAGLAPSLDKLQGIVKNGGFTRSVAERAALWEIRDGIFPCVAGARTRGDAVILEDVAAPVAKLHRLVEGLQKLFGKYEFEGSIFGHARDGNVHPLVTSGMDTAARRKHFAGFMDGMVDLVLSLDGSLKGEHGTGRAVAPFIEKEWGPEIYGVMKRIKRLADPEGLLNPGVLLNDDPEAHLRHIKKNTPFDEVHNADACIECGYCEHVCPSRYATLTPRQRIQARRVIARTHSCTLAEAYLYEGLDTCAADGMCQTVCPMKINTGDLTDTLRQQDNPPSLNYALTLSARHFGGAEKGIRGLLRLAKGAEKAVTDKPLVAATRLLHTLNRQVPVWNRCFPMPRRRPMPPESRQPAFVYFPSCVTRIFGASGSGKPGLEETVLTLAARAGIEVRLPADAASVCCSQIWEHKGDREGQYIMANKAVEHFWRWSEEGKIPIFCDTASCTHTLLTSLGHEGSEAILTPENLERYHRMTFTDLTQWLEGEVLPRLTIAHKKGRVLLHPTCACDRLGLTPVMRRVAEACAAETVIPDDWGCCGASGDRGFVFPELAASGVRDEKREIGSERFDGYYSLARTCEISMQDKIGLPYESIAYLVEEASRP